MDEEETGEIDFVEFCKYVPKAGHIPKGDIFRKGDKDRQGLGDKIMKFLSSWKRPVVTCLALTLRINDLNLCVVCIAENLHRRS